MKTVLLISGEKMFSDTLIHSLLNSRLPLFNLLRIENPSQITDSLLFEEIDVILYDHAQDRTDFARLVLRLQRAHPSVRVVDVMPFGTARDSVQTLCRGDSFERLENALLAVLGQDAPQPPESGRLRRADRAAAMTLENLERLTQLCRLYELGDRQRFLLLIESVLTVNLNHTRLCRQAGEMLIHHMTAFVNDFACLFSLQQALEEAQYPDLNFNEKVNNRQLLSFWQRLADRIFASEEPPQSPNVVQKAKTYVAENLKSELSTQMVAEAVGVTAGYLSRAFSHHTGITLIRYISEQKNRRAQELLTQTDAGVKEIAEEIGFSSPSYFIRFFRKYNGVTPKQYRDGLAKEAGGK